MEALNNYNYKEYNFTIWFFRLLVLIATTIIVLVFVLYINETVTVSTGEIVSSNPQADYKAPFEAQVIKIFVKEGKQVKAGDTLLVMQNLDYLEQHATKKTEIIFLEKKIKSIAVLQDALQRKKVMIDRTGNIAARKYQLDINSLVNDMQNLDQQYASQKERLSLANEKYIGDSILYKKDMLSKYEFNTTKEANSTLKESFSNIQNQRIKQASEKNLVYNNFTKEQNSLQLEKVQLDENAQALIQAKNEYESQLIQAKEMLHKIETELNEQNVIAKNAGIVNFVYNTKQSSNVINKGDLLISIAPYTIAYYAKVIIPEKDMPYVKAGLPAHLRLDAYQHFEHGPIDGKVSYVAERKENDKFYALVELSEINRFQLKSGYSVYGEIVVARLPLYRYFIKKLFKRVGEV
ncbi:HlyD family secretion protein [Segetibacter koreensis]|uniref:HlyD family secretion protein n=1 Tax=Segetibacter koreensis TaxID=398037 RepID=UPI0003691B89|nr:HlyD family efflux transporter periplasmic adaptor subunit [Segetibacter koreensis]